MGGDCFINPTNLKRKYFVIGSKEAQHWEIKSALFLASTQQNTAEQEQQIWAMATMRCTDKWSSHNIYSFHSRVRVQNLARQDVLVISTLSPGDTMSGHVGEWWRMGVPSNNSWLPPPPRTCDASAGRDAGTLGSAAKTIQMRCHPPFQ